MELGLKNWIKVIEQQYNSMMNHEYVKKHGNNLPFTVVILPEKKEYAVVDTEYYDKGEILCPDNECVFKYQVEADIKAHILNAQKLLGINL